MDEYIERDAICYQLEKQESIDGQPRAIRRARRIVADFPAADVVARDCYDRLLAENDELRKERPVRHGRWENGHCTRCGEDVAGRLDIWTNVQRFSFCPFCGARMDLEGNRE